MENDFIILGKDSTAEDIINVLQKYPKDAKCYMDPQWECSPTNFFAMEYDYLENTITFYEDFSVPDKYKNIVREWRGQLVGN